MSGRRSRGDGSGEPQGRAVPGSAIGRLLAIVVGSVVLSVATAAPTLAAAMSAAPHGAGPDSAGPGRAGPHGAWPDGAGPDAQLESVSCSGRSFCIAVGGYGAASRAFAEMSSTTGWKVQTLPQPAGVSGDGVMLAGISCPTSSWCMAVGYYTERTTFLALAEQWSAGKWSIVPTAPIAAGEQQQLWSVSCVSPTSCTTVGDSVPQGKKAETLAETWSDKVWSTVHMPSPAGVGNAYLSAVSCLPTKACAAVGFAEKGSSTLLPVAMGWNGNGWTAEKVSTPTGGSDVGLDWVSCAAPDYCVAVGSYLSKSFVTVTLAETWNGSEWMAQPTLSEKGAADSYLDADSCTSSKACQAVGYYLDGTSARAYAATWGGTAWAAAGSGDAAGQTGDYLYGVSCSAPGACTAVGNSSKGSASATLIESLHGSSWSVVKSPNP